MLIVHAREVFVCVFARVFLFYCLSKVLLFLCLLKEGRRTRGEENKRKEGSRDEWKVKCPFDVNLTRPKLSAHFIFPSLRTCITNMLSAFLNFNVHRPMPFIFEKHKSKRIIKTPAACICENFCNSYRVRSSTEDCLCFDVKRINKIKYTSLGFRFLLSFICDVVHYLQWLTMNE